MPRPLRSLYICYFPLTEPLVQTQVVAYLRGLAQRGHHIHLMTFEPAPMSSGERRIWRRRLKAQGIIWHHLRYHKRPSLPATVYDVMCGVTAALRIIRRYRLEAVHARSHVPATMGLILKRLTGCRFIFDIRGLLAEEYVDAGNWRQDSVPFRLTKNMEKRCIENADGIVVLTERVRRALFEEKTNKLVRVIPCCADLTQIEAQAAQRNAMRAELGLSDKTVMIYTGKLGGWYMQREMVGLFSAARDVVPNLHFLVLTQSDAQLIVREFERYQVSPGDFTVTWVEPARIGAYLAAADFAISFIKPCPSKIASSPTKVGEYLAAGLPLVCTAGVGDMDAIIKDNQVGVTLSDLTPAAFHTAIRHIMALLDDAQTRSRCQQTAHEYASLQDIGVPRYDALYNHIARSVISAR